MEHLEKILSPSTSTHLLNTQEEAKEMDFGVSHTWAEIPLSTVYLCDLGQVAYLRHASTSLSVKLGTGMTSMAQAHYENSMK